jgi:putative ABC transport system ATP-binding protein
LDNQPILETLELSRIVGGVAIVDRVTITVQRGDVLAVLGPSGAGKTSFLRLLNRLDEPTSGEVLVGGRDYREILPDKLRRSLGMVMQQPNLFPGTVADNISYGPAQRGEVMQTQEIEALLERVNLAGFLSRDVAHLSGGEAQRVSLARTLANNPQVLLLDEPTAALDDDSRQDIEDLVMEIIQAQGLTCVLVTHASSQALKMAGRALVMEQGRVIRTGSVAEVLDVDHTL